jgi:hypothetical protein
MTPIIVWLCSLAHERVSGGLTKHFLKTRLDVGVDEGDHEGLGRPWADHGACSVTARMSWHHPVGHLRIA